MDPHTAHPRPVENLSPLQTFAQTAKPRETQTNVLAHALTGSNGGAYSANMGEQNAWERNLMATASLRGKIGELSDGWKKTSSTLKELVEEVRHLNLKQSRWDEDSQAWRIEEAEGRSKLITELRTVSKDLAEKMTEEHRGITEALKDENARLQQQLQRMREQLDTCQQAALLTKKMTEKASKEEDRQLSAKRPRKTARKTPETNQNSTDDAVDLSLDPPVPREIPNSQLQEEQQDIVVAVLLEGVPMQSRRRLSISPEADETLR